MSPGVLSLATVGGRRGYGVPRVVSLIFSPIGHSGVRFPALRQNAVMRDANKITQHTANRRGRGFARAEVTEIEHSA